MSFVYLILTTIIWDGSYYLHFNNEETEAKG